MNQYSDLNPEKALIWRIVHRDNMPWILEHGLHAGNSSVRSSNWVHIGSRELTVKRSSWPVLVSPNGTLNDYVPFYFTPFSIMMKNIHSGWAEIPKVANDDIIILVSSIPHIEKLGLKFVFTDSHAYSQSAKFYTNPADLDKIDWPLLQNRDFKREPNNPKKFDRYQAEALIYQHCPIEGLLGMVCYSDTLQSQLENDIEQSGKQLKVYERPKWYFK